MKRRKRLRIDRILYCLIFLVILISLIKLGITSLINYNIYKSVTKDNLMKLNKKEIDVWTKTINYINEKTDEITIKRKNYYVTLTSNAVKNHMNIELKSYNKKLDEGKLKKQKGLYIENNDLLEKTLKLKIKMPYYLRKNGEVDVYGIKDDKYYLHRSKVKVKDKYITFDLDDMYEDYFITYVQLDSINTNTNLKVYVGDEIRPSLIFVPNTATNKSISYSESKKLLKIKGSTITAVKTGTTVLTIKNKKNNISTDIKITIKKKKKETKKEEEPPKEEPKTYEVTNIDGVSYIGDVLIVNKTYSLPSDFNPGGLTDDFMNAFYEMQAAAELDGIELWIQSGFRDYDTQSIIYNNYVNSDGRENADRYSARAGYSEHQSGLAADINNPDDSFNGTKEAEWLANNCYKYGFIIRFPDGKEESTGYKYESWHVRYLGKDLAETITNSGLSLEEYFGITSIYSD